MRRLDVWSESADRTARMTADEPPALELPGLVRDKVAEGRAKARATRARKQAEAEITDLLPVARLLLARLEASDHEGRLSPLKRVVSAEPVLASTVAGLAAALAERYAGTRSD